MGSKNITSTDYMANNDVFSGFFNLAYCQGRNVIKPEMLQELDSKQRLVLNSRDSLEKGRDTFKLWIDKAGNVRLDVLGVEIQTGIDYLMVHRTLTYNTMAYNRFAKEIARKHAKTNDLSSGEYISGFFKADRLFPAVTPCLYLGDKDWDGVTSFRDIVEVKEEWMRKFIPDYNINVIRPKDFSDELLLSTRTSLGAVFGMFKYSRDEKGFDAFMAKLKEQGKQVFGDEEIRFLNSYLNTDFNVPEKGEKIDMCEVIEIKKLRSLNEGIAIGEVKGLELGLERGKAEGLALGKTEGRQEMYVLDCKEFGCAYEETIERFMNKFCVSDEEAREVVNRYWPMN